ncbi:hypothetical protein SAY87_002024 [Trapa incisa]|uniref:Phytocyanin domain-containing protein n=1 Tax=Trapa incisa TaxID=236973 RepID=A0AAN7PYH9_9MYRT|nr:hypothetical protein SAY87_002024 [Trapa incisa]
MSWSMRKLATIAIMVAAALSATTLHSAEATTFVVGDGAGWTIPSTNSLYSNWSNSYTFKTGDILVFNFVTNRHNVVEVSQADYDSCNTGSTLQLLSAGPATITLNETKTYYFLCTVGGHCASGQKVAVTVRASSGTPTASPPPPPRATTPTTPSSSPPPPGTTTATPSPPPPPGSGSTSLAATAKVVLLSVAVGVGFMWVS